MLGGRARRWAAVPCAADGGIGQPDPGLLRSSRLMVDGLGRRSAAIAQCRPVRRKSAIVTRPSSDKYRAEICVAFVLIAGG